MFKVRGDNMDNNKNEHPTYTVEDNTRDYEGLIKIYRKAPIGKRFLAYLLDFLIGTLPVLPGIIVIIVSAVNASNYNRYYHFNGMYRTSSTAIIVGVMLILVALLWRLIYNFTKDGWGKGQSLGKRALGLMVVNLKSNGPCGIGDSILRRLISTLLAMIPLVGWLIEPIMVIANEKGKRLGDMAVSTQVIEVTFH